jgi:hypothetical protein
MLEFLIDNIFVIFGGQSAYLWVHTASLLADLFLYLYEAYRGFSRKKRKGASQILSFHILFRYFIRTTSYGISDQLRDIYSICRHGWNVATYKW